MHTHLFQPNRTLGLRATSSPSLGEAWTEKGSSSVLQLPDGSWGLLDRRKVQEGFPERSTVEADVVSECILNSIKQILFDLPLPLVKSAAGDLS